MLHSQSSEQQNLSEPNQESQFYFHGDLNDNGVNDTEDECVKQDDNDNTSNIALVPNRHPASVEHACRLSCCSCGVDYDEIMPESTAATSLEAEKGFSNHHAPGGNTHQWQNDSNDSIDPVDLEKGSVKANDVNSDLPREKDNSSKESWDQDAVVPVVETSNQVEHPRPSPSPDESLHSARPERDESTNESELQVQQLFHAFPDTKWFRSEVFAGFGFCIMTLMVLGNLIYTYNPLRSVTHL